MEMITITLVGVLAYSVWRYAKNRYYKAQIEAWERWRDDSLQEIHHGIPTWVSLNDKE